MLGKKIYFNQYVRRIEAVLAVMVNDSDAGKRGIGKYGSIELKKK